MDVKDINSVGRRRDSENVSKGFEKRGPSWEEAKDLAQDLAPSGENLRLAAKLGME